MSLPIPSYNWQVGTVLNTIHVGLSVALSVCGSVHLCICPQKSDLLQIMTRIFLDGLSIVSLHFEG